MDIIHGRKYYTGYPGRPIAFLNKWEDAAVRYNKVAEPGSKIHSDQLIEYLSQHLKVLNDTENIVEQVKDTTTTFEEMTSKLREKFAQREYLSQSDKSHTRRVNKLELQSQQDKDFGVAELYINAINANDPEWRVGKQLWNILTPEQQKLILFQRKQLGDTPKMNTKPTPSSNENKFDTVTSIVKNPGTTSDQKNIPKQYNSNKANFQWENEENETSLIEEITESNDLQEAYIQICKANDSYKINNTFICKAHVEYIARLSRQEKDKSLTIIDSGADTHVFRYRW